MKCETKIRYITHDKNETPSHYLCGRTVTSQIEFIDSQGLHNASLVCGVHKNAMQRESERLLKRGIDIQLIVTDAK